MVEYSIVTRNAWQRVGYVWNWKCALLSAAVRGVLFFTVNLSAGLHAAEYAALTDLTFRAFLSGTFGALIQALAAWRRQKLGTLITLVAIPAASHAVEFLVHSRAGTARLTLSVMASVSLTLVTSAFDLFAMRRHALLTGAGALPLWDDLARMPALIAGFLALPLRLVPGASRRPPLA